MTASSRQFRDLLLTASPSTAAATATHGGATLPDMPAGVATAADVVAIIARHLAIADYIATTTTGDGSTLARTEANAHRWVLATISDHAASVARDAGRAADASWAAAEENAVASEQPTLTAAERRPYREFSRLHVADAKAAEARHRAAGELATTVSEVLYP